MKLRKDVFLALATIVRADGKVTSEERDALLAAARASALSPEDMTAIERSLVIRTSVGSSPPPAPNWTATLEVEERAFVYSAAAWLASVDGHVSAEETQAIARLGETLGLSPEAQAIASLAARMFSPPSAHDVHALANEIRKVAAEPD